MESIRDYLLGITAAALICGIAVKLLHKGLLGSSVKLIAGIFLTLAIVSPLVEIRLDSLDELRLEIQSEAADAAAEGENSAREAMAQIISEQTAAYILDKAESLEVELTVEVTVSQEGYPVPEWVRLEGNIGPYAKSVLSEYIANDLGIGTEGQKWIS